MVAWTISLIASFEMAALVRDTVVAGAGMDEDACYVVAFPGALCREHVWKPETDLSLVVPNDVRRRRYLVGELLRAVLWS